MICFNLIGYVYDLYITLCKSIYMSSLPLWILASIIVLSFQVSCLKNKNVDYDNFSKYYKCMRQRKLQGGTFNAEALLLQEKQILNISCNICYRPDQSLVEYDIRWRRHLLTVAVEEPVKEDGERVFIDDFNWNLVIVGIRLEEAGQYYCSRRGNSHSAVYYVDVVASETRVKIIPGLDFSPKLEEPLDLEDNNLLLVTRWAPWSSCNKCGETGHRLRHGTCVIKMSDTNKRINPIDEKLFKLYPNGVPCRSSLLRDEIATLDFVKSRPSETIITTCKKPCPTLKTIQEFTDSNGLNVKLIDTSKGFSSFKEALQKIPKPVKRKSMYQTRGLPLELECPDKQFQTKYVEWQNGSKPINPLTIEHESNGRISIDIIHRIKFKEVIFKDTAVYSCWIEGNHVASLKLTVVEPVSRHVYRDYVIFGGCAVIVSISAFVFFQMLRRKNKKTLY